MKNLPPPPTSPPLKTYSIITLFFVFVFQKGKRKTFCSKNQHLKGITSIYNGIKATFSCSLIPEWSRQPVGPHVSCGFFFTLVALVDTNPKGLVSSTDKKN